jgi:hypothetical protein
LLGAAVAVAALVAASPAAAKEHYCSPSGDVCTSVAKLRSVRYLRLGTFSFTGRVKICVKDPTAVRVCRNFRLPNVRKAGPIYQTKVLWKRNYPNRGPGTYRVTFFYGATKLGPALTFTQS